VFDGNDLPLCRVCSAVASHAGGEEAQAEAAGGIAGGGEGSGAAGDGVAEGAVLRRGGGRRAAGRPGLPPPRRPVAPPPEEAGAEAAPGGRQGEHTHVPQRIPPHRAGRRRLPAVHPGPAGRGGSGRSRSSVRLPEDVRLRGGGVPHGVPELTGVLRFGAGT